MNPFVILITKPTGRCHLSSFDNGMKEFLLAAILIVLPVSLESAYAQAQSDTTIYVDPGGSFEWVIPAQKVKGLEVEILACYAYLKKGRVEVSRDTTFIHFFVPENFPVSIEIRQNGHFSKLRSVKEKPWPKGLFQCLGLPQTRLGDWHLEPEKLLAVGNQPAPNGVRIIPVAWNARLPDSLREYEFRFKPNLESKVAYSISDNQRVIISKKDTLRYYRAGEAFPVRWNGRINGQLAPEGIYVLTLEGYRYAQVGSQRLRRVWRYDFYHQPVFDPCSKN